MIITLQHARAVHACVPGLKAFFDRHPALSFKQFITSGIEDTLILQTNDAMACDVVRYAHAQANKQTPNANHIVEANNMVGPLKPLTAGAHNGQQ